MRRYLLDFDPDHRDAVMITKVWYSGGQSIQAVPSIVVTKDTISSIKIEVKYYMFVDSALHKHLCFTNFADTAQLVAKSYKEDLFSKYGGWNLYSKAEFDYDKMEPLKDTIIDNRHLKRYILLKTKGNYTFNFIVYGSCADKDQRIKYLPTVSRQIGCPVVRMDTYYKGRLTARVDIAYIANQLSVGEKKVFMSWAKKK